jgi:hypothetical protein
MQSTFTCNPPLLLDLPIVSESHSLLDTEEKRVIEWKFSELDTDKDESLGRHEVRQLKDIVKKLVRPKACARDFESFCDRNQDDRMERNEWSVCLGVDQNSKSGKTVRNISLLHWDACEHLPAACHSWTLYGPLLLQCRLQLVFSYKNTLYTFAIGHFLK